jgi:hypothetical protein
MILVTVQVKAATPKPSIPTFNLKYYNISYDVPPTYTTDPYSGKTLVQNSGYHVNYTMIAIIIDNQPFNPYWDDKGNYINLFYDIRFKGHFETNWSNYTYLFDGYTDKMYPLASNSAQTVILGNGTNGLTQFKDEDQVDFQIAAKIGYEYAKPIFTVWGNGYEYYFYGETSEYSNIQTITIGDPAFLTEPIAATSPAPQPTPRPTATPTQTPTPTLTPSNSPQTSTITSLPSSTQSQSVLPNNASSGFNWESTVILMLAVLLGFAFLAIVILWRKIGKIGNKTYSDS